MQELARLLGDFAHTIAQSHSDREPQAFFGFRDCAVAAPNDAARFRITFAKRAAALLEGFDQWLASRGNSLEPANKMARVGLGVYLVNGDAPQRNSAARMLRHAKQNHRSR
jgi:RNase P protein component